MMKFSDDVPVKNALLLLCGISIETYFTTDPDESIEPFIKHFQKLLKNYNHDEIYEITIKRKI
jgi:hypothetical protein